MTLDILQIAITVLSILLFLRIYWIQASSNSLVSMMNMQKKEILSEIEFAEPDEKLKRMTVIEAFSYLNLVAKLYLNHSINTNMLKTFEGVMIKLLNDQVAQEVYREIFFDFRDNIKTAEPPYINLIFAADMLVTSNRMLNRRGWLTPLTVWMYMIYKKFYFKARPFSRGSLLKRSSRHDNGL